MALIARLVECNAVFNSFTDCELTPNQYFLNNHCDCKTQGKLSRTLCLARVNVFFCSLQGIEAAILPPISGDATQKSSGLEIQSLRIGHCCLKSSQKRKKGCFHNSGSSTQPD